MIRKQTIMLGDSLFVVEREHAFNDQLNVAKSEALVCPKCLRVWAILHFEGDQLVWPVGQCCKDCWHPDEWIPVPGSLLNEEGWGVIDDSLLAALPEPLIKRELNLHLKAFYEQIFFQPPERRLPHHGQDTRHPDRQDGLAGVGGIDS